MSFHDYAATEASTLIARLLASQSDGCLDQLRAVRAALDAAAHALEAAPRPDADVQQLVARLTAAFESESQRAAEEIRRVTEEGQRRLDESDTALMAQLEENGRLASAVARSEAEAALLKSELSTAYERADSVERDSDRHRRRPRRARAHSQRDRQRAPPCAARAHPARRRARRGARHGAAFRRRSRPSAPRARAHHRRRPGAARNDSSEPPLKDPNAARRSRAPPPRHTAFARPSSARPPTDGSSARRSTGRLRRPASSRCTPDSWSGSSRAIRPSASSSIGN